MSRGVSSVVKHELDLVKRFIINDTEKKKLMKKALNEDLKRAQDLLKRGTPILRNERIRIALKSNLGNAVLN